MSDEGLERMLFRSVKIVARQGGFGKTEVRPNPHQEDLHTIGEESESEWAKVALGEGLEIHLRDKRPLPTYGQRRQNLRRIEKFA